MSDDAPVTEFEPLEEPSNMFVGHEVSPAKKPELVVGIETHEMGCGPEDIKLADEEVKYSEGESTIPDCLSPDKSVRETIILSQASGTKD